MTKTTPIDQNAPRSTTEFTPGQVREDALWLCRCRLNQIAIRLRGFADTLAQDHSADMTRMISSMLRELDIIVVEGIRSCLEVFHDAERVGLPWDTPVGVLADKHDDLGNTSSAERLRNLTPEEREFLSRYVLRLSGRDPHRE